MKLVELNWAPTDRQLRQFGVISLLALPFLGWLWGASLTLIAWLAAAGAALLLAGLVAPRTLKPIYLAVSLIAIPIGMVIGELVLLLIYFAVFLPIGLVFRLMKRDRLQLRIDRQATTYWQRKKQPAGPASYYHQS